MYISVTGLQLKGILSVVPFWWVTIPAFRSAQTADGILVCKTKKRGRTHHTLTVWESKKHMMAYRAGKSHLKAMKIFSKIATGAVLGYEGDDIPDWKTALARFDSDGRAV